MHLLAPTFCPSQLYNSLFIQPSSENNSRMPKRARPLVIADDEAGCSDADDDEYCSEEDEANSLEDFIVADDESETGLSLVTAHNLLSC